MHFCHAAGARANILHCYFIRAGILEKVAGLLGKAKKIFTTNDTKKENFVFLRLRSEEVSRRTHYMKLLILNAGCE